MEQLIEVQSAKLAELVSKLKTQPEEVIELLLSIELHAEMLEYIKELQEDEDSIFSLDLMKLTDFISYTAMQDGESVDFRELSELSFEMASINMLRYFRNFLNSMLPVKEKIKRQKEYNERFTKFYAKIENPSPKFQKFLKLMCTINKGEGSYSDAELISLIRQFCFDEADYSKRKSREKNATTK